MNPADGALLVASHEGLFRTGPGDARLARVGTSARDTMGFAVIGPNRFLASGHPDPQTPGPGLLGLISSTDSGRTWESAVLEGEADLHVIRPGRKVFYAQDATENRLFKGDLGTLLITNRRNPPGTTFDLAIDPRDDGRLFASTDRGVFESTDGAGSWKLVDGRRTGLLAFAGSDLLLIEGRGTVVTLSRSRSWKRRGSIRGAPAAVAVDDQGTLYAAVQNGTVLMSTDRGGTWSVRVPAAS